MAIGCCGNEWNDPSWSMTQQTFRGVESKRYPNKAESHQIHRSDWLWVDEDAYQEGHRRRNILKDTQRAHRDPTRTGREPDQRHGGNSSRCDYEDRLQVTGEKERTRPRIRA